MVFSCKYSVVRMACIVCCDMGDFLGAVGVYMVNARYGCLVYKVSVGFIMYGVVIVCDECVSYDIFVCSIL